MLGTVEGKASNRKFFSILTFTLSLRLNLCKTANLPRVIIVGTSDFCGGGKKSGFFSVTSLIDELIHLFLQSLAQSTSLAQLCARVAQFYILLIKALFLYKKLHTLVSSCRPT